MRQTDCLEDHRNDEASATEARELDPHQAIGAEFRYVVWRWAKDMALGGGASSPVAKEGPL
jgi:hypothetical protein